MSTRLDYARAKQRARAIAAARDTPPGDGDKAVPHIRPVLGWRTEWPEEFPVTVTRIKPEEKAA